MSQYDHHRCTPQGRALGKSLATMATRGLAVMEEAGMPDTRCASCAFREGTVPNGCPQTVLDALKCLAEGVRFGCHAPRDGSPCHGYTAAVLYTLDNPLPQELLDAAAKYPFSNADQPALDSP